MFSILNRALSWAITSFENKFCLKKRSRLIKSSDNRFDVKFMQLEIGLFYARMSTHKADTVFTPGYTLCCWDGIIQGKETDLGYVHIVRDRVLLR